MGSLDFGFWGRNPKSKIQNPQNPAKKTWILEFGDFGFWGFWILDFWDFEDFGFWIVGILDFGGFGFWGFCILDFGDFGFWIFGIWDFGFLRHYAADLYVQSLDFGIWGFWILGILDFGLGILDGHLVTKFWMLHKKRSCARRPGSADLEPGFNFQRFLGLFA